MSQLRQARIDYQGRDLWCSYHFTKENYECNIGDQACLHSVTYMGRDITRLVNQSNVEDLIVEHEINYATGW